MSNAIAVPLTGEALVALLENPIHDATATKAEGEVERTLPAYVGFRGAKAEKNLEALDAAGIKVDQFYLRDRGEVIPLQPCDLHVLHAIKFFTLEEDGKLLDVAFEDSDDRFDAGYRAVILAVVAVRLGNGQFVAATLILRSGQTKALEDALKAIDKKKDGQATTAEGWAARGKAHADSAGARLPGLRFFVRIYSTREGDTPSSKYNLGHGTIIPTPKDDVERVNTWLANSAAQIAACFVIYQKRIDEAREKANGSK